MVRKDNKAGKVGRQKTEINNYCSCNERAQSNRSYMYLPCQGEVLLDLPQLIGQTVVGGTQRLVGLDDPLLFRLLPEHR